jgi:hypothetical protein
MRKWTHADGVPQYDGPERFQTLQSPDRVPGDPEGDRYSQPIYPVFANVSTKPYLPILRPHPLLCAGNGVIARFPDHMHEGCVVEDNNVNLHLPLEIAGIEGPEYPPFRWPASTSVVPDLPQSPLARPRPHVIAHAITTNPDSPPRVFGLIGTYDGDGAGVGRVVVDSTWHHWFSYNLHGFIAEAPEIYKDMQQYYRNVAFWLSTPSERQLMLIAATWNAATAAQVGLLSSALSTWKFGEHTVRMIERTVPTCIVSEFVASMRQEQPTSDEGIARHHVIGDDTLNKAWVGSIGKAMFRHVRSAYVDAARGRTHDVDPHELLALAFAGADDARRLITATVIDEIEQLTAYCDLAEG